MRAPQTTWKGEGSDWLGGDRDDDRGPTSWDVQSGPLRLRLGGVDWREYITFRIGLSSSRRTGARVALEVLGPEDRVLGQLTFAVDWVGRNDMQLWLASFEPRGDAERWGDVRAVRLQCVEPGWWPTTLRAGQVELTRAAPAWRVNESDTIIEMGWHAVGAKPGDWQVVRDATSVPPEAVIVRTPWPWTQFGYRQTAQPGRLTMLRAFDVDLQEYSQFLGKMMWDRDTALRVTAVVDDGREIVLLDGTSEWPNGWLTFGAPLGGARHLSSVRLTMTERESRHHDGREVGMGLFWLLLREPTELDIAPVVEVDVRLAPTHRPYPEDVATVSLRVPQIPAVEPSESITAIGDPLADGLPFGFFVSREELPGLRDRALNGALRTVFSDIRAEADRALATELVDRNYYGSGNTQGGMGLPKGLLGAGMRVFAPTVAITHLITGEKKYAVACRRWILRAARSDDWRGDHGGCVLRPQIGEVLPYWDSFTGWYPRGFAGYMNHPFMVADVAFGVVVAYDML